jgi:hypothetical protein
MRSRVTAALVAAAVVQCVALAVVARGQEGAGITLERRVLPRASEVGVGDRVATIVRFDLRRYRLTILTASDGPARTLRAWVRDFHLAGGINAGMFLPSGRPVGFVQLAGRVLSARRAGNHRGLLAFDPLGGDTPVAVGGHECGTLEGLSQRYGSLLQGRELLVDCHGRAVDWRTRRYSAAALGTDDAGRAVLVHVRTPYRMQQLARMLAGLDLGLRGLVYMEGGPEASIVVHAEGQHAEEMGSWEDGFHEADDLHEQWDLPNVVGLAPR